MDQYLFPTVTPDQMLHRLTNARRRVVILDYDGTLAPFVVKRDQAFAYPGIYELLDQLMQRDDTRLVIVTGRSIADILPLLKMHQLPEIRGSHGWERRDIDGTLTIADIGSASAALHAASVVITDLGLDDRLERKPVSLALHWRGVPDEQVSQIVKQVQPAWEAIAAIYELRVHPFDGGLELRIPGKDKGTAVHEILSDEPSDAFIIYLGDDLTDEDAFASVRDRGYGVLIREELRLTKAQLWTRPPAGLLALLEALSL